MSAQLRVAATLFLGALLGGLALRLGGDYGTAPWMISRVSGLVAFALLSASVVFGLLQSTKAADGWLSRPFVFAIHQFVSVLSVTFIGLHAGSLLFDGFLQFGPARLLIPFLSLYRPFWVGLGVIAGWLAAIVTASFWMRSRVGQKRWRALHYASFAAYVLALVHGITAGSDTGLAAVQLLYIGSGAAVAGLLTYRLGGGAKKPAPVPSPVRAPVRAPGASPVTRPER
ncbi:MAG: ferric reductase-like transmembrane domain-containing protein [Dehalococcoidia bacterium]|nr:ferric reductase-like transmembrane domain-containing protein [Dehalococcoidia bacterium]